MSPASLLHDGSARQTLHDYYEPRAAAIDAGQAGTRDGIAFACAWLRDHAAAPAHDPNADLLTVCRTIATIAWSDMSSAFTLWCQRMVLEYLALAQPGTPPHDVLLPSVQAVDLLGSTALAAGMAHAVSGAPLPVAARRAGDTITLDGRIPWASNLFPPELIIVTAARDEATGQAIVVALPGGAAGVAIPTLPHLLALNATGSSSLMLHDVTIAADWLVIEDFPTFIARVRPPFLLLQSSFAWGLARRSLDEAGAALSGMTEVFRPEYERLSAEAERIAACVLTLAPARGQGATMPELVQLRFDAAQLATAAVALEAKAMGGRGYVAECGTTRRLREAAFLPVQAPTEAQLRWELQRYASRAAASVTASASTTA